MHFDKFFLVTIIKLLGRTFLIAFTRYILLILIICFPIYIRFTYKTFYTIEQSVEVLLEGLCLV